MEKEEFDKKIEFLRKYQELQIEIIGLSNELEKWGRIGTTINQKYQCGIGMSTSVSGKPELAGVNIAHVTAQIQSDIDKCIKYRDIIKKSVEKVKKKRYRDILMLKFINGMSNKDIAELISKNERSVYRVIKKAVEYIDI